jgi:two-component system, sensor histidine kinase YesM
VRFYENWGIIKRLLVCLGIYCALCLLMIVEGMVKMGLVGAVIPFFLINSLFFYRAVLLPLRAMDRQFLYFNQGYDPKSIFSRKVHFTPAEQQAFRKIQQLLNNHEVNRLSNRQAQYLALQNQINPHFLYNTLEAIRGDALSAGMDNIASITEAVATFFRYTISNMDNLVTLEEELANAENYFSIQNYRFGDRISMQVEIEKGSEASRDFKIPKLTLQPIIENAIIHGLEHQVGPGKISVHICTDGQRLLIEVADDGVGMSESMLEEINRRLINPETAKGGEEKMRIGGIALVNVDNRIKLLFGEQFGLRVSSIVGLGTRVEITLPVRQSTDR